MKRGAIFVNTSRGPVQDERALFKALATGQLAAGGIDVSEEEPTPLDNPILNLPNVIVPPHRPGVTREANRQRRYRWRGRCCACCGASGRTSCQSRRGGPARLALEV